MKRHPRQGLFNGYWLDMAGNRLRRIARAEFAELYRLNSKHQDIQRYGRHAPAIAMGIRPFGQRSHVQG